MGRRKWRVVPSEVQRMIKATQSTGLEVTKVELTVGGDIIIGTGKPGENDTTVNPWTEGLKNAAQQKRAP